MKENIKLGCGIDFRNGNNSDSAYIMLVPVIRDK